jgi:hypothetical protein
VEVLLLAEARQRFARLPGGFAQAHRWHWLTPRVLVDRNRTEFYRLMQSTN